MDPTMVLQLDKESDVLDPSRMPEQLTSLLDDINKVQADREKDLLKQVLILLSLSIIHVPIMSVYSHTAEIK
jgi:hypothetical protein